LAEAVYETRIGGGENQSKSQQVKSKFGSFSPLIFSTKESKILPNQFEEISERRNYETTNQPFHKRRCCIY
jgi:hypothetical protein